MVVTWLLAIVCYRTTPQLYLKFDVKYSYLYFSEIRSHLDSKVYVCTMLLFAKNLLQLKHSLMLWCPFGTKHLHSDLDITTWSLVVLKYISVIGNCTNNFANYDICPNVTFFRRYSMFTRNPWGFTADQYLQHCFLPSMFDYIENIYLNVP